MITRLRPPIILGIVSILLLAVFGASYTACLHSDGDECCQEEERDCSDPLCDEGASCHCACALAGIMPVDIQALNSPDLTGELESRPVVSLCIDVSNEFFRPPRLA